MTRKYYINVSIAPKNQDMVRFVKPSLAPGIRKQEEDSLKLFLAWKNKIDLALVHELRNRVYN